MKDHEFCIRIFVRGIPASGLRLFTLVKKISSQAQVFVAPICALLAFSVEASASSIESFPWNPEVQQASARAYLRDGRLAELRRAVKALKVLAPSDGNTLSLESRLLEAEENWPQIIKLTGLASELPVEAKLVRAKAMVALGKLGDAEKILLQLIGQAERHPDLVRETWETYGDLAIHSRSKDAISFYRKALEAEPENSGVLLKMAEELSRKGRAYEASKLILPLTEGPLPKMGSRFKYVGYLEQAGQIASVGQTLQAWIRANPDVRWQELTYANLLERLGEIEGAQALRAKWGVQARARPDEIPQEKWNVREKANTVKVRPGDTLQSISEKLYGTTKRWREIRAENPRLFRDGDQVFPGMELKVPEEGGGLTLADQERIRGRQPSSSSFLVPEANSSNATSEPTRASSEASMPDAQAANESRNGYLWVAAGFSQAGNSLAGSGFQAKASPDIGNGQRLQAAFSVTPGWSMQLSATRSTSIYSSLAGLSPSSLSVTQKSYLLGAYFAVGSKSAGSGWLENLELGLGWKSQQRDATATAPNVVVAAYRASGPVVAIASQHLLYGSLVGRASAAVFLPTRYSERNTNTGRFSSARGIDLELQVLYPLIKQLSASFGVSYHNFRATFSESGSRGSSGASETSSEWLLPVGLRWSF